MKFEVDSIALSFGDRKILSSVYIKAETGQITGILGRNGCGKTSLLTILFGSLTPTFGSIRVDNKHQHKKLFQNNFASYLPQHRLIPRHLTLYFVFALFEVNWLFFIKTFPSFSKYKTSKIRTLSSGEIRVIETYIILSSNKPLILLDEPFSFIAPVYIEKIKDIILVKKVNTAMVITDHFYHDILEVSDHVYFLKDGYAKAISTDQDLAKAGYISSKSL